MRRRGWFMRYCVRTPNVYMGETKRTLKTHIVEHKQAVKKFDEKNGEAVHANTHDHRINWEEVKVVTVEQSFWRRRVQEAIREHRTVP